MSAPRDRRLNRAQMVCMFKVPFFAPGLLKLPVHWSEAVPTWATNGKEILANPKWTESLPDECLPTIFCHEVAHCLLGHGWRKPPGADDRLWNIACDHVVNLMLKEFSAEVMARNLADPFPFPDPQDAYCADPRFKGMAEEKIYRILEAERPPPGGGGGGGGGGKPGKGQPAPHTMPQFGDFIPAPAGADTKQIQADWDSTAIQSAKINQGRGELPGAISRLVDSLTSNRVNWLELLRSFLREQASDDWAWHRPALEYSDSDFILPSLYSEKVGRLVFATDTSGSTVPYHAVYQAEKQSALDSLRPSLMTDIYCDSAVQEIREYSTGDRINLNVPGGGGTDFRPVFEQCEKMDPPPKCLVYLTDLCGAFPDEAPPYPVLWISIEKGATAPFGEVIYAGED